MVTGYLKAYESVISEGDDRQLLFRHASGHEQRLAAYIVNNYNYARSCAKAIDSALDETYRNTEVIVVDDGSTDRLARNHCELRRSNHSCTEGNGGPKLGVECGFSLSRGCDLVPRFG